jgi:acyl-CoA thioester hydrolase
MSGLLTTYQGPVLSDWVDYNGHLRDAFYLLIFSYATDGLMDQIGLDSAGRAASGHSLFTLECHLNYLHEVKVGALVQVRTQVLGLDAKRLHIHHTLHLADQPTVLAANEQMLLHVAMDGPRATPFVEPVLTSVQALASKHQALPRPEHVGRVMALPKPR